MSRIQKEEKKITYLRPKFVVLLSAVDRAKTAKPLFRLLGFSLL